MSIRTAIAIMDELFIPTYTLHIQRLQLPKARGVRAFMYSYLLLSNYAYLAIPSELGALNEEVFRPDNSALRDFFFDLSARFLTLYSTDARALDALADALAGGLARPITTDMQAKSIMIPGAQLNRLPEYVALRDVIRFTPWLMVLLTLPHSQSWKEISFENPADQSA